MTTGKPNKQRAISRARAMLLLGIGCLGAGLAIGWWGHEIFNSARTNTPTAPSNEAVAPTQQQLEPGSIKKPAAVFESGEVQVGFRPASRGVNLTPLDQVKRLFAELYEATDAERTAYLQEQIASLVATQIRVLREQKRPLDLQAFLDAALLLDPMQNRWRYELAQAQYDSRSDDEALDTIYQIYFDQEVGALAQELERKIRFRQAHGNEEAIQLDRQGSHYVVVAAVKGAGLVRLIIDTGASLTTLSAAAVARLGLPNGDERPITLAVAGGTVQSKLIKIEGLQIGAAAVGGLDVAVIDLQAWENVDGLLGMNFLQQFKFRIDQQAGMLRIGPR